MSSAFSSNSTFPDSMSSRISFNVFCISFASSAGIIPCAPNIPAWAILPVISSLYILWSKEMEEWKWSVKLSVCLVKRPPQSLLMLSFLSDCLKSGVLFYRKTTHEPFQNAILETKDLGVSPQSLTIF